MALNIRIPDSAWSEQQVTISNNVLTLAFKFNSRNDSWYVDISNSDNTENIISGLNVMPNQNLTGRYFLSDISEGNIWCVRKSTTSEPIGRDNFGIGKDFELWYIPDSEEQELGINGTIQL